MRALVSSILGTYTPVTTGEGIGTVDFTYVIAGILLVMTINFLMKALYKIFFD